MLYIHSYHATRNAEERGLSSPLELGVHDRAKN